MQGVVIPAIGPNTFPGAVGDVGRLSMPGRVWVWVLGLGLLYCVPRSTAQ